MFSPAASQRQREGWICFCAVCRCMLRSDTKFSVSRVIWMVSGITPRVRESHDAQLRDDFWGSELVPGRHQSRYKRPHRVFTQRSAYLSKIIPPSPSLSPLGLWMCRRPSKRTVEAAKDFPLCLFLPSLRSTGVVSRRQFVNKHRWWEESDGAEPADEEEEDKRRRNVEENQLNQLYFEE